MRTWSSGASQVNANYFTGDIAEVQIYSSALAPDSADALANTLGSKYGVVVAPPLYSSLIGLNLQSSIYQSATIADIRIPFTVDNPSQYARLILNMQYDDGFVAYLNGTEIARRNAPSGAITYTSVAPQVHPQSQAIIPESIDVSSFINLLLGGSATNVLAIKALNSSLTDPDMLIRPQLVAATVTTALRISPLPRPARPTARDTRASCSRYRSARPVGITPVPLRSHSVVVQQARRLFTPRMAAFHRL